MSYYYEEDLDTYLDNELGKVALTKRGQPRKRKPKEPRVYFTTDTEEAIIEYLASDNQDFRNKLYRDRIEYAFYKLAENIIHTFKFYYTDSDTIEELKHEVVTFLLDYSIAALILIITLESLLTAHHSPQLLASPYRNPLIVFED